MNHEVFTLVSNPKPASYYCAEMLYTRNLKGMSQRADRPADRLEVGHLLESEAMRLHVGEKKSEAPLLQRFLEGCQTSVNDFALQPQRRGAVGKQDAKWFIHP